MKKRWVFLILCLFITFAYAQNATASPVSANSSLPDNSTDGFDSDPILKYRPSFACSLPIQLVITGIVLTLTSVLLIHLIFTGQYHWPLAPVNYALQISAVVTLLISLIATLRVILQTATDESRQWPYMLNYISVDIPPLQDNSGWSTGELAAWLLMNATTSALIQITHIQFLTLLFPSNLERRLIFILLGPLAIVAAVMQLVPVNDTSGGRLTSISSAVQNVCNATLSLLFTASLFIWGLLVNRKQAWRTDGGTAAFGAGALMLAIASTAITFVYIPSKDQYDWMPGLMWSVILWQSFLGWWWWVGAGMGVGEVDELLRREEKRRKKRKAKLEARKARKEKAQTFWRGVAGALGVSNRRHGTSTPEGESDAPPSTGSKSSRQRNVSGSETAALRPSLSRGSATANSATNGTASDIAEKVKYAVRCGYGWYLSLRHAHLTAAREQAEDHAERIQQVYGKEGAEVGDAPNEIGWGLGSFGIRQMRDVEQDTEREEGFRGILEESARDSDEWVDEHEVTDNTPDARSAGTPGCLSRRRTNQMTRRDTDIEFAEPKPPDAEPQPSSMWYWGPLRRWRLQDSTTYS